MSAIILNCLFFLSISCNSVQEFKLNWVKNKDWSIRGQFLREIAERSGYNVFIETGTFEGETAFCASKYFRSVHTIELSHQYYSKAHSRFAYSKSIHVYHGSSVSVLKNILPNINGKIVFWLDAHYSGGGTAKDGALNTPILQELEAIKDCGVKDSIILIDDIRLFDEVSNLSTNQSIHGYPSFKKLCEVILNINPDYNFYFFSDLAIAVPADCVFIVSPIVKACTKSRLFEDDENVSEVLEYENQIGLAQGIGREDIINLAYTFK